MQFLSPEELEKFRTYREKFPNSLAFQHSIAPHNSTTSDIHELSGFFNCQASLKEMALEFQLEQYLSQSKELIHARNYISSSDFLSPHAGGATKATLSLPSFVELEELLRTREKRNEIVNMHSTAPDLNPCLIQADILRSEVTLATDMRMDIFSAHTILLQYFKQRKAALVQKKFKNLLRYTQFCVKSDLVEKITPVFKQRLSTIEAEYGSVTARCLRLQAPLQGPAKEQNEEFKQEIMAHIDPSDFVVYLRWLACHQSTTKNINRFIKRVQWALYTSRLNIHRRSIDILDSENINPHEFSGKSPWITTTAEELSELLDHSEEARKRMQRKQEPNKSTPPSSARSSRAKESSKDGRSSLPTSARAFRPAHDTYNSFVATFKTQASMMQFPAYESAPPFMEWNAGLDSTGSEQDFVKKVKESSNKTRTYLKHSTWLSSDAPKPNVDPLQVAQTFKLSQIKNIDEILKACAAFLDQHDETYVTSKLLEMVQKHAEIHNNTLNKLNTLNNLNNSTNISNNNPTNNPTTINLNNTLNTPNNLINATSFTSNATNTTNNTNSQSAANFFHPPLHMDIPLDSPQLSIWYQRHLHLRTLKRRILRLLNYFRSMHKKLTFDLNTFYSDKSAQPDHQKMRPHNWDNELEMLSEMNVPLRRVVNPTPSDFDVSEEEIMYNKQMENRDDRYIIDADGEYNIKDAKGVFVMYDISLQDFAELEDEILRIGTHFLRKSAQQNNTEYDRTTMLQELYEQEFKYLEAKRKIVECYVEIYEHLIYPAEQTLACQLIFDWIAVRPQIHWLASGITEIYSTNIEYLTSYHALLRKIINSQLEDQRMVQHIHHARSSHLDNLFGFPDPPTVKQVVYLFPQSVPIGVFDFCESLSAAIKIDSVIKSTVSEFVNLFRPSNPLEVCAIQRAVLEHCMSEWVDISEIKHQFDGVIPVMEDPLFIDAAINKMAQLAAETTTEIENAPKKSQYSYFTQLGSLPSNKIENIINVYINSMQFLIMRKELLDVCFETDILAEQYRIQADKAGFPHKALDLDVPFFPSIYEEESEDQSQQRTYLGQTPAFSIGLFDPTMCNFDFTTLDGIQDMISPESIARLHKAVQVQFMHKNLLVICVQYNQITLDPNALTQAHHFFGTPRSVMSNYLDESDDSSQSSKSEVESTVHSFLTLNDKCATIKDTLSSSFSKGYSHIVQTCKPEIKPHAVLELKMHTIEDFCSEIMTDMYAYSLRHQMVWVVASTLNLLKSMKVGEESFLFGEAQNRLYASATLNEEDFGMLKKAPQLIVYDNGCPQIMSREGKTTNVFYIPHYTEILRMFEDESLIIQIRGLSACLRIFYAIHDIVVLLYHQTKLSFGDMELSTPAAKTASVELQKLKNDIAHLNDPTNPQIVVDFLWEKRKVIFFRCILALENFADNLMMNDRLPMYHFVSEQIKNFTDYTLPPKPTPSPLFPSSSHSPLPSTSALFLGRIQEFYDSFMLNHHDLTGFTRFHFFSENVAIPFAGWVPKESYAPEKLAPLLQALGDSDRKFIEGEFQAIDLQLEEDQVERGVLGHLEDALKVQVSYLATSLATISCRRFFLKEVTGISMVENKAHVATMDQMYKDLILTKVWKFFRAKQKETGQSKELHAKQISEYTLRSILLRILKRETSSLLLRQAISTAQENLNFLLQEKEEVLKSEEERLLAMDKDVLARVTFMEEFVEELARKSTLNPANEAGNSLITLSLDSLNACLDHLALRLKDWGAQVLTSRTYSLHTLHTHLTNLLFLREQEVRFLEHQAAADARNVNSQVELEVSNRGLDLVFEVNSLHRQMLEMKEKAEANEKAIRRAVKEEYESIVNQLQGKLINNASQFETYKAQLHRDLLEVVASLKGDVFRRFVDYDTITAKVAANENVTSSAKLQNLLMENLDYKKTILKYQTTAKMKEIGLRALFDSKIKKIDEEKQHAEKHLATLKQDIEMREAVLRQQLAFTQSQLGKSHVQLRDAIKEKEKSEKRNEVLSKWKNAKSQVLMELEEKVKSHEKYDNVDVEQLLKEVENLKIKLASKTEAHEEAAKSVLFVESRYQKEISRLQKELANERKMKQIAFDKLRATRENQNSEVIQDVLDLNTGKQLPYQLVASGTLASSSGVVPTPPSSSRPQSASYSRSRIVQESLKNLDNEN